VAKRGWGWVGYLFHSSSEGLPFKGQVTKRSKDPAERRQNVGAEHTGKRGAGSGAKKAHWISESFAGNKG
jgi:hypothetical protein